MSWSKRPVHWEDDDHHYISFVFSWDLWQWCQSAQPELSGKKIIVGGPAVYLNREWVPGWVRVGEETNALPRHNILATRTTLGCIRKCKFCAVPQIEPQYIELDEWEHGYLFIDNNFLACSDKHFNKVIDKIKYYEYVEFNQGLDARLLTKERAERLAECNIKIRFALDHTTDEGVFLRAFQLITDAGIPKHKISVYVLIGFDDTPADALYRLSLVNSLGAKPNPMRYQPLHAKKRNEYVSDEWTNKELIRYMRYWQNLRYTAKVPFADFV